MCFKGLFLTILMSNRCRAFMPLDLPVAFDTFYYSILFLYKFETAFGVSDLALT